VTPSSRHSSGHCHASGRCENVYLPTKQSGPGDLLFLDAMKHRFPRRNSRFSERYTASRRPGMTASKEAPTTLYSILLS